MVRVDFSKLEEKKTTPESFFNEEPKEKGSNNQKKAYVVGLVGEKGTGKTKSSGDFTKLLSEGKKMLYFDSESKSDKVLDEWFDLNKIDIINFTQFDPKTGKTLKMDTLESFEKDFQEKWIPKLKSGTYEFLVLDKGNVFWKMGQDYYYTVTDKPQPAQFAWGKIYALVLDRIFEPLINICRFYDINLIMCFNTKGQYANDKQIGMKANVDNSGELLGYFDYYVWMEQDYEKFIFKHPLKAYWRVRDEDTNITDYLFNRDFILDGKPVLNRHEQEIKREFKRYVDFMEDTVLTTNEKKIRNMKLQQTESESEPGGFQ